ncbi:anti-sigma-D factor RsdA [Saccharomonospora sp. NPDC046836]|uniref:anti-sigma-D factor RsdA n=1 Tax=Saccharomonospora sp. NPDC046836 TaxID=3156921 RepID=UPI0033F10A99
MTERDGGDREPGEVRHSAEHPPTAESAETGEFSTTFELSALQADDALLDALGGSDPRVADGLGDQELNTLLLAWRRDIDSEPMPELVDTPQAVTTIKTATLAQRSRNRGRKRRMLVPVAAAAAVLAIGFTGTALAARSAQPGDTLWALSKVLYADHARSVEAAASVRTELQEAQLALAQQRYDDARQALNQAQQGLSHVTAQDELAKLKARHTELMAQLNKPAPPPPTTTTTPLPTSTPPSTTTPPAVHGPTHTAPKPNLPPSNPPQSHLPESSTSPTSEPPTTTTNPPPSSSTGDTTGSGDTGSSGYSSGSSSGSLGGQHSAGVSGGTESSP